MHIPSENYIKVGSINTRYWADGEGSPVVLIHGLGGSANGWLTTFDPLCTEHRVYALDLIGHGKTDRPTATQDKFSDMADFVCDFMAILGIDQAHIMGHSMGGAVALQLVIAHPERVQKLILADAGGLGKGGAFFLRLLSVPILGEIMCRWTYTSDLKKFGERVRASSVNASYITDELIEQVFAVENGPEQYKMTLRALRMGANVMGQKDSFYRPNLEKLSSIKSPTLLIWGRQDNVVPLEHGKAAVQQIPGARLEVIENCGHVPMYEQPEIFNKLVLDFLR